MVLVSIFAEQIEQLGVAHGDQEVKAIVRVAHNQEQGGFPVSQGIQLQLLDLFLRQILVVQRIQHEFLGFVFETTDIDLLAFRHDGAVARNEKYELKTRYMTVIFLKI